MFSTINKVNLKQESWEIVVSNWFMVVIGRLWRNLLVVELPKYDYQYIYTKSEI